MRTLFILLATLFFSVTLGWLLQQSPNGVVFTYKEWIIQTSLAVFVLASTVLFLLLYALLRALQRLLATPAGYRRWSEYRRGRRAEMLLKRGLLSMAEGDWRAAERAFRKGAAWSRAPLVNYLGAAQAAYRSGATDRSDHYLNLAQKHNTTGSMAVGLARARLQIDNQEVVQAGDTLSTLEEGHNQVILMLLETAVEMEDWSRATRLLKEHGRRGLLPPEQFKARQVECYAGLLREAGGSEDKAAIQGVWKSIPGKLKQEVPLICAYVKGRLRRGGGSDCELVLRRALKRQWDPELMHLFGLVEGRDLKLQLEFAEGWLARFPQDAALLLALGRLCKKNRLWGKARGYLERSARIRSDPVTCRELAILLEQQGEPDAAGKYFRHGLELATM